MEKKIEELIPGNPAITLEDPAAILIEDGEVTVYNGKGGCGRRTHGLMIVLKKEFFESVCAIHDGEILQYLGSYK